MGVRVVDEWTRVESPLDVVARIAPTPLLIVHGRDDHFFDEEEAWALYRAARPPKRLLLGSRFGHAQDGYSESFGAMIRARAEAMLEERPPPSPPDLTEVPDAVPAASA
jgi:fermentation-respiration switch protein FrsA (DUF1100 family)